MQPEPDTQSGKTNKSRQEEDEGDHGASADGAGPIPFEAPDTAANEIEALLAGEVVVEAGVAVLRIVGGFHDAEEAMPGHTAFHTNTEDPEDGTAG